MKLSTIITLSLYAVISLPAQQQPNIVFIFIDDIGWGDLSCYGNTVQTKLGDPITQNMDTLAADGIRFTQGYVGSPICSPSRTAVMTGMEPGRFAIHSFLNNTSSNASKNMNDWLNDDVVTVARIFQNAGYETGMFGKWHMGGGRDVNDAPFPQDYGFDDSLTSFEGMGDRILYLDDGVQHGLSQQNADVPGTIEWVEWEEGADKHTDAAIAFITDAVNQNEPFFVYVPHDDTHSPYDTDPGKENDFDHVTSVTNEKLFLSELHELDKEIGRLITAIDALGVRNNTLIVIVGDNGANDPSIDSITVNLNRNGGLRGGKRALYEGGIREPFIISMPGTVPTNTVNSTTAVSTYDLLLTFCELANITPPKAPYAGESMLDVFQGSARARVKPLYWEFGTNPNITKYSPGLAVRNGNYKLLREPDGTSREFYDLSMDLDESNNLINDVGLAATISDMETELMAWYDEVILGNTGETIEVPGVTAGLLIRDTFDVTGGNSTAGGFGDNTGVNQEYVARQSGQLAGELQFVQIRFNKAAADHSINSNTLTVSDSSGVTLFHYSDDGTTARDFGPELAGNIYEWRATLDLDDTDPNAKRMSLSVSDDINEGVDNVVLGFQLKLEANNTTSVYKRIDANSNSTGGDINTTALTGLTANAPVDIRVVMDDSTNYTGYNTSYELFVNGNSVETGSIRFLKDNRYILFDTATNTGPARYNDFELEVTEVRGSTTITKLIPTVCISEFGYNESTSDIETMRVGWTTQPGDSVTPEYSSDLVQWNKFDDGLGGDLKIDTIFGTSEWYDFSVPSGLEEKLFLRFLKE